MAKETGRVPKALRNRPDLNVIEQFYHNLFWVLHHTRALTEGGGTAPIKPSEILAVAQLLQIEDTDEREELLFTIISMDLHYRRSMRVTENSEKAAKETSGGNSPT